MPMKPCLDCGKVSRGSRCPEHERQRLDRIQAQRRWERGTRKQRGYDEDWYRRVRAAIKAQPWCTYCGATTDLTGDHAIPLSRGGSPDQTPIVACRRCNARKGARVPGGPVGA